MTRGKFAIITDDETLGEGFCIGHSYFCNFEEIDDKDTDDLNKEVREFNENNHKYEMDDGDTFFEAQNPIDFSNDYFEYWFSDFLYIKNLASTEKAIKDRGGKEHTILPNQIVVFNFGYLYGTVADDGKTLNYAENNED